MSDEEKTGQVAEVPKPGEPQAPPPAKGTTPEPEVKVPEKEPETEVVVDLDSVEQAEDGQLVLRAGESVYKGKTLNELFANVQKGIADKDSYIAKSKVQEKAAKVRADKIELPELGEAEYQPPDQTAIYETHAERILKRERIDPGMLSWSDDDWARYAEEKGLRDFAVMRLQNRIENVKQEIHRAAQEQINKETVAFVNRTTMDEEIEKVVEMITTAGLEDDFDDARLKEILEATYSDPGNQHPSGTLKSGRYIAAVAGEILKVKVEKSKTELQKKIEEDIARGREKKVKVRLGAGSTETFRTPRKASPTMEDAYQEAIKELQSRK